MSYVSMKSLLEAGVHFGHQTRRWNPKMKPYIFTERNGIYIIDLLKTSKLLTEACEYVKNLSQQGQQILFVSTKKQAQDIMKEQAELVNMPYVSYRWLGGTLTNYETLRRRVQYLTDLENKVATGEIDKYPKKEQIQMRKELVKLQRNLGGLKKLNGTPAAMYVIDPKREAIATREARKMGVKIISIVDTNCDPDEVDLVIPGNDDAIRAVRLITKAITDAIIEGAEGRIQGEELKAAQEAEAAANGAIPIVGSISDEEAVEQSRIVRDATTAEAFEKGLVDIEGEAKEGTDSDKLIIAEDYN